MALKRLELIDHISWKDVPVSDEQAFEAIKTSLDSVPPGVKMILNSGSFESDGFLKTHKFTLYRRVLRRQPTRS